jgi:putative flavoprotein involved in K+ transport
MTAGPAGPPPDVLVIGGGQAGLAMGYHLRRSGWSFQIADGGAQIGQAWRARWDSLRLFTSGRYASLPGLPFPAAPESCPGKDDVADCLQAYAARFELPVRLNTKVTSLTKGDGGYVAKAGGEALAARQVVVATGAFPVPFTPPIAGGLDPGVHQVHSARYRRPQTIPPGKVLVAGAANSGCQIARELSATRDVELSAGQQIPAIPQRPLGRDIWTWATALGWTR